MVIGTAAYCGSGQDTLADSICKIYGMKKYSIGDVVRKIAIERGLSLDRSTLRSIRKEYDIKYGRACFSKIIVDDISESGNDNYIITGIRTMDEYNIFKQTFNFKFIFLNAQENIRFERMLKRKEKKDESNIVSLKLQMEKESIMFDYDELMFVADLYFDFNLDLDTYYLHEKEITRKIINSLGVKEK